MPFQRRYSIRLSVVGGLLALTAKTALHFIARKRAVFTSSDSSPQVEHLMAFETLIYIDKKSSQALPEFVTDGLVKRGAAARQRALRSVVRQEYQRGDVFAEAFGVSGILLSSSQSVFSCVQWATLLAPFFAPVLVSLANFARTS